MKSFFLFLILIPTFVMAQPTWKAPESFNDAGQVLNTIYGAIPSCSQDADADTNTANRLGPFLVNEKRVVYCHNGTGSMVACTCLTGGSSVSAVSSVGKLIPAGGEWIFTFTKDNLYISCVPFVDNQKVDACKLIRTP